jgi:hypothetical protein
MYVNCKIKSNRSQLINFDLLKNNQFFSLRLFGNLAFLNFSSPLCSNSKQVQAKKPSVREASSIPKSHKTNQSPPFLLFLATVILA